MAWSWLRARIRSCERGPPMYASRDPSGEMARRPDQAVLDAIAAGYSIASMDRTTCLAGEGRTQPHIAPPELSTASTVPADHTVVVLAMLISGGAIWGWMRPAPAKQ